MKTCMLFWFSETKAFVFLIESCIDYNLITIVVVNYYYYFKIYFEFSQWTVLEL